MKLQKIIFPIVFIAMVVVTIICWNTSLDIVGTAEKKMKAKIGKSVVIEKDTSVIVNYSIINNTFTLSNGKEISAVLVQGLD